MIRLLIIDDHEMVREGLKAMLTTEPDFTIVGDAANAEQAFELIERLRPDVIQPPHDARVPGCIGPGGVKKGRLIGDQLRHVLLERFAPQILHSG